MILLSEWVDIAIHCFLHNHDNSATEQWNEMNRALDHLWAHYYRLNWARRTSWGWWAQQKEPEGGTMPYSYRMISRVLYSAQYHRQHRTCPSAVFRALSTAFAQPRWQTSDPAGIWTQYIWFSSHDRTEWAIKAGLVLLNYWLLYFIYLNP